MTENTQYWINRGGDQSGPHTIEQLQAMAPFDVASTYVWHKGMDGWMRIDKLPELAHLTATATPQAPEEADATVVTDHEPQQAEEPQAEEQCSEEPTIGTPPPYSAPQPPRLAQPAPAVQPDAPQCPPTNLVAAIVCAVLCCTPLAIVAIVLAVLTKNKYQAGDYAKAEKYSEWGAWLCIASVVLSVLLFPFSMLVL